jgi:N-methylhydantoinase B
MMTDRVDHPPLGLNGGGNGAPNVIRKADGTPVHPKARTQLFPGETIEIHTAGGAGYGDATKRDPELRARDIELEYVKRDQGDAA